MKLFDTHDKRYYHRPRAKIRIFPRSRLSLARILMKGWPRMSPAEAIVNADTIIKALHKMGMQIGPLAAFGPSKDDEETQDAFSGFAEMMEEWEERTPWNPPELK